MERLEGPDLEKVSGRIRIRIKVKGKANTQHRFRNDESMEIEPIENRGEPVRDIWRYIKRMEIKERGERK